MVAFTHLNPEGSRVSDGTYVMLCPANDVETAITETRHHCERFMRATKQGRMELSTHVYMTDLDGEFHDLPGQQTAQPLVDHNDNYTADQHLARTLRKEGSNRFTLLGYRFSQQPSWTPKLNII